MKFTPMSRQRLDGDGANFSIRVREADNGNNSTVNSIITNSTARTTINRRKAQLNKHEKELHKLLDQEQARKEVEQYDQYIASLRAVHTKGVKHIPWSDIKKSSPPYDPLEKGPHQLEAERRLANYKPSLFAKLFRKQQLKQTEKLEQNIVQAVIQDEKEYSAWKDDVELAARILAKETEAYMQILTDQSPFSIVTELANRVSYEFVDGSALVIEYRPRSIEIIPTRTKSLTATGKLSTREMGKSNYYRLYQDYICSCILRIARDIFALLPLKQLAIHVMDEQLNTATGYQGEICILSVNIDQATFNRLLLNNVDPSDAINNFQHNMKFMVTSGFKEVERITI